MLGRAGIRFTLTKMKCKAGSVEQAAWRRSQGADLVLALLLLAFYNPSLALEFAPGEPSAAPVIEVVVAGGLLSLDARDAPLSDIVRAIGKQAEFATVIKGDFSARVTRAFTRVPLESGLKRLVGDGVVLMQIYAPTSAMDETPRLVEVRLHGTFELDSGPNEHALPDRAEPVVAAHGPAEEQLWERALGTDQEQLTPPLEGYEANARVDYILGMAGLTDPLTVDILSEILAADHSARVRRHAARALAEIGGDKAGSALESALGDRDAAVRSEILRGLVAVEAKDSGLFLGQALFGDPDAAVRRTAVQSLATQQSEPARAFLEAARADADPAVRAMAETALKDWITIQRP